MTQSNQNNISDDTIAINQSSELTTLPQAPEAIGSGWMSMLPMVLIFVVMYFLLIRPQEKKRREQQALVSKVKVGEEVLTNSGIFGRVVKVREDSNIVEVEIAPNTVIKIDKNAIADITSRLKLDNDKSKK